MFKKFLAVVAAVGLLSTNAASALVIPSRMTAQTEALGTVTVSPASFAPASGEETVVSFDVDVAASITVRVTDSGLNEVAVLAYDEEVSSVPTTLNYTWDGTDADGNDVAAGEYGVRVYAYDLEDGTLTGSDLKTVTVVAGGGTDPSGNDSDLIDAFELNPDDEWDPTEEDLEIDFEITEDLDDLVVEAREVDGNKVVEILDDNNADSDDYEESWDGEDDDGDLVDAGYWDIVVTADGQSETRRVEVVYDAPEIKEAFVTKDEFDPDQDEFTNLVFKVDADAVVTIEMYDGSRREFTLVDEEDVNKNDWNVVKWDGTDDSGDEVDFSNDWTFKIRAENEVDDSIYDEVEVNVDVDEDDVSSRKANVTNDFTEPVVFNKDSDTTMSVDYCVDEDSDIYLAVYDGKNTSGNPDAVLLDYVSTTAGCHTVNWNLKDDRGRLLSNDVYTYELIARNDSGSKDTEEGRFVVGDGTDLDNSSDTGKDNNPLYVEHACSYYYYDTRHLEDDNELCLAIAWGTEQGIFHGYADGSFRAYQNINRAEVLKVVLLTFGANILPLTGSDEGFTDVDPMAWYMTYVRTGKYFGMFNGYDDATARLANDVNRVEFLKLALESSARFLGNDISKELVDEILSQRNALFYNDVNPYDPSAAWYLDYAATSYAYNLYNADYVGDAAYLRPSNEVERGEVALVFYRMAKAGLL